MKEGTRALGRQFDDNCVPNLKHANLTIFESTAEVTASKVSSFFFFPSRRRHTRLVSDWSSDVCSSDLPGFAADIDDIIATVAIGLGIERDRGLQAGLRQIGSPESRSGLLLELSPTWGVIEITADRGVVPQRGRGGATTTLESIYAQHDQLGAAIKRAKAKAMSTAFGVLRPFF